MDAADFFQQIAHLLIGLAFGWLALIGYRWVYRRSKVIGLILGLGILARIAVGLALFWISYLGLPVAESMQAGGGFWQTAVDATRYHTNAITAVQTGVFSINYDRFPSPFFVRVLALWFLAVGISPASGLFLNICVYIAVCVLIVRMYGPIDDWRRDLPCIVGVGAYSFWPSIFIHGTQPLKDELFLAMIAFVCLGMLGIFRLLVYGRSVTGGSASLAIGALAVLVSTFGLAGIRWYFPVIVCGALLCVFALFAVRGRSTPLPRYAAGSFLVVTAVFLVSGGLRNFGSGFRFPVSQSPPGMVRSVGDIPSGLARMTRVARTRFLLSGGSTNVIVPVSDTLSEERSDPFLAIPRTRSQHLKTLAVGLAIVFVPISVLKSLSVVDFPGGRGFLPIADLDTVFQDVAILCLLALVWTRRHAIGTRLPFVAFCVILAGTTAVLLGYVVTNYGTLFRMRSMIAIPLCVLVVALSSGGQGRAAG